MPSPRWSFGEMSNAAIYSVTQTQNSPYRKELSPHFQLMYLLFSAFQSVHLSLLRGPPLWIIEFSLLSATTVTRNIPSVVYLMCKRSVCYTAVCCCCACCLLGQTLVVLFWLRPLSDIVFLPLATQCDASRNNRRNVRPASVSSLSCGKKQREKARRPLDVKKQGMRAKSIRVLYTHSQEHSLTKS